MSAFDGFARHEARQIQFYYRTLALFAADLHAAAGLLRETVYLGEPQACALADLLGGEEGIKARSITSLLIPTPVSVTEIMTYCPGGQLLALRRGFVVKGDVRRFYRNLAAVRHRVASVDREVQNRALELIVVGGNPPQAFRLEQSRFLYCRLP